MKFAKYEDALRYTKAMRDKGFDCQIKFLNDGIAVVCIFAADEKIEEEKKEEKIKTIEQKTFDINNKIPELKYELRDYQQQALNFALKNNHTIIEIPTGRGKTLIAIAYIRCLMKQNKSLRALIVVPTLVLLNQWTDEFREAGMDVSNVSGRSKTFGFSTIITYQSGINYLDNLYQYDIFIFDEIHHAFAPEYVNILKIAIQKRYVLGLTATVREYGEEKTMQNNLFRIFTKKIEEFQGNPETKIETKIYRIPVSLSLNDEILYKEYSDIIHKANKMLGPVVNWHKYFNHEPEKFLARKAMAAYAHRKTLLTENPEKINEIIKTINGSNEQWIIFSDTIEGIKGIEDELNKNGIIVGSIYTGINPNKRKEIINGLKNKTIQVLIGGNAISEGLDLPNINNGILSSLLVRSSRVYIQRIGRLLRPLPGKNVKIYLIYNKNTIEEEYADKVNEMLGDKDGLY